MQTLIVPHRFRGPTESGNGGYTAGLVAGCVALAEGEVAEVTLRAPPPLDTSMRVEEGEAVKVWAGETLVAEGRSATMSVQVPEPVSAEVAAEWARGCVGFEHHAFPQCFTCGPHRDEGDGLRVFPGRVEPDGPVAAPWTPPESLFVDGALPEAVMWAALDCPGYFGVARPGEVAMLGRMAAQVMGSPKVGERCVSMGWSEGREGRKLSAGTAVFGADGRLLGCARQLWIALKPRG